MELNLRGGLIMSSLKRTALYPLYQEYGAKVVDFSGFEMPVQFSSIIQEHEAVRTTAGLFDVSHMGEFEVTGPDARKFLNSLVSNDLEKLTPGMAMYSPLPNEHGGCVDDLLIYCFAEDRFWTVVNAGNIEKDYRWLEVHSANYAVTLRDLSSEIVLLALQGPSAQNILQALTEIDLSELRYYRFIEGQIAHTQMVISRTGYTGEDGFELYMNEKNGISLWRSILSEGADKGLIPCGLGARDTLRLESRLPLYGHELTDDISPLEAGLGMFVKLDKAHFVGQEILAAQKATGLTRKIVGFQLTERGIPRAGYSVYVEGEEVGVVTSGTLAPTLKTPIGLALVDIDHAKIGASLEIDIRGKRVSAEIVKTPFYKRT
jgi:aminomethyltransferase